MNLRNVCNIQVAVNSGFCFGVKRATDSLEKELSSIVMGSREKIYTLGHIIHNETYIHYLEEHGVKSIDVCDIAKVASKATSEDPVKVFIRAHGIPLEVENELKLLKESNPFFDFVDCTCPFVKKIHRIAAENSNTDEDGENVLIVIGSESHPEVLGILSYFKGRKYVFSTSDELMESIKNGQLSKLHKITPILVAQTTQKLSEWEKCKKVLKSIYTNSIIFDTICSVTEKRQAEAEQLSRASDLMVVVGGRESSNTSKLYAICKRHCKNTVWVETVNELGSFAPFNIYRGNADTVKNIGVVAGASTPCDIIQEVVKKMSENFENRESENFEEMLESSFKTLNIGDIVVGTVIAVNDSELQLDIMAKNTGVIQADQITDDPSVKLTSLYKIGDTVEGFVIRVSDVDGFAYLSKKRVDADRNWASIVEAKDSGAVLDGKVIGAVKGGVVVLSNSVRIFVPASQTGVPRDGDLSSLVGNDVKFKVLEIKPGKKAIGSIRVVLAAERKARIDDFWASIEVGKVYNGIIKNLTSYGAFVDLGGVDGLILVSELSWKRVAKPEALVKVGDELTVFVKSFDAEKRKIVLGHKTEETRPWYIFSHKYAVGDVVNAKIVNIVKFGAFAEIIEGVDGLIHISEIAKGRVENVESVLSVGQEVNAKIIAIDDENQKISLSLKALLVEEEKEEVPAEEVPSEEE